MPDRYRSSPIGEIGEIGARMEPTDAEAALYASRLPRIARVTVEQLGHPLP